MGYSEVMCHICGVGFNISRIRTPKEPRSAAWGECGPLMGRSFWENPLSQQGSYVDSYGMRALDCEPDAGCMFTIRKIKDENRILKVKDGKRLLGGKSTNVDNDDKDDDWFEPEDEDDDEPLEYASDDEMSSTDIETQNIDTMMTDLDENTNGSVTWQQVQESLLAGVFETHNGLWVSRESFENFKKDNENNQAWYSGIPYYIKLGTKDDVVDDMFPLYQPNQFRKAQSKDQRDLPWSSKRKLLEKNLGYNTKEALHIEHVAGPGCNNLMGYSGHNIDAAEMRGCLTLQCLVRKPKGYIFDHLPDDEDFERSGGFFLSGLSDHMPSRDSDSPHVKPARHGCESPYAENYMFDEDEAHNQAMPFHPSCLEVYKRASMNLRDKIDINALTSWWSLEADYNLFHHFPRDPNVRRCNDQSWAHHRGTEYLVANPLHIPKLREIFTLAVETNPAFSSQSGAFNISERTEDVVVADPFNRLPAELRFEILDHLSSRDISSLRLSSRVFCQLPVGYFQKLLSRECPWLWEAWPTGASPSYIPYAKWACWTAGEIGEITQRQQQELAILDDYCKIVKEEMPELAPYIDAQYEVKAQAIRDAHQAELEGSIDNDRKPFHLPPDKTNYFTLYTLIERHWQELRGLQNRKRIWEDCEEILKRAGEYRKQGRFDDNGITEDLRNVVINNQNR